METTQSLRSMAEQGDADAQFRLGYRFAFCRNRSHRRPWKQVYLYHEGIGVKKDPFQAVMWYRRASFQGDAKASFNLGLCYAHGDGVPRDIKVALNHLTLAARKGHRRSRRVIKKLREQAP